MPYSPYKAIAMCYCHMGANQQMPYRHMEVAHLQLAAAGTAPYLS